MTKVKNLFKFQQTQYCVQNLITDNEERIKEIDKERFNLVETNKQLKHALQHLNKLKEEHVKLQEKKIQNGKQKNN